MLINKSLKEDFSEFCEKNYSSRIYRVNLKAAQDKWFYLQVGNSFKDFVHIEYINFNRTDSLQFHIEFDKKQKNTDFYNILKVLDPNIANFLTPISNPVKSNYVWFEINGTSNINNWTSLENSIKQNVNALDSVIAKFESFFA